MSWLSSFIPSFFNPIGAALFALLIPIIIFYFLKLRRTRVEISSLALWQQVINDQRVNAPFQKFKRNFLLFLQLLLLCLVALAAMQPYWKGNAEQLTYLPILIDVSASMGSVDQEGDTRLDLAKAEILQIVDGLLPDQKLTLIAVGASARRLTEFTDNKQVLKNALAKLKVQDVPSNVVDGLRLAQALSRTQEIKTVRFYSDGNLPTKPNPATGKLMAEVDFDLPFSVDFFQIDSPGNNIGITALNARRATPEAWDVFLRVEGAGSGSTESKVILKANGELVGDEQIVLGPGEAQRIIFKVDAQSAQYLEATLEPVGHDALQVDNQTWLNLPKGRDVDVFCPGELTTFRHALEALEGVDVFPLTDGSENAVDYDLLISDKSGDLGKPAGVSVFIGVVPEDLKTLVRIEDESAEVVDWQRDAQILQHVQLKDVVISELPIKNEGVEDIHIEELGYKILAHGNRGPLILSQRDGIRIKYYLLFHTDRSTLPYRVGFPVLVANIMTEAMQRASLTELRAPSTGVLPAMELAKEKTYRVTLPDGKHERRSTNEKGLLKGISATMAGEYEIRDGGELVTKVGVGLLNATETRLETVETITFNELSVEAERERLLTDKPLWTWFAAFAFVILLVEWWYFQKKPTGIPD